MAYTLIIGNYDRNGWFKPFTKQNDRRYKTINGARKAAYNCLMEFKYDWASADSPIIYIKFNGSDYGYAEQSIKNGRRFVSYKGSSSSVRYEIQSNGQIREI